MSRLFIRCFCSAIAIYFVLLLTNCSSGQTVYPISVAANNERIVIADLNLPGIWEFKEGTVEKLLDGSKKFREPLNRIRCVAFDNEGNILAGDSATRDVYRIEDGKPVPLTSGGIGIPMSIGVRKSGEIVVADLELGRIYSVPAKGGEPKVLAEVAAPRGLFVDAADNVWVISGLENPLIKIGADGKKQTVVENRPFDYPSSVVVDGEGNAFVCDSYAKAVWKVTADGEPEKFCEGPFNHPVSLAIQGERIFLVDPRANALFEIDKSGEANKLFESSANEKKE